MSKENAIAMLVEIYQFSPEAASSMITNLNTQNND